MSEQISATGEQRPPTGWSRRTVVMVAIALVSLLMCLRAASELAMMSEYGPDAQMPIWQMFFTIKLALWLFCGVFAIALLRATWGRRWGSKVGMAVIVLWTLAICNATWQYDRGRRALADASSPATSPARLSELAHFDGIQAGYELDNRLASNPTTPPDTLRELSQRQDQSGTLMSLLRNPSTPDDLIEQIRANRP